MSAELDHAHTGVTDLAPDTWAAIGRHLPTSQLVQVACSSRALKARISSNDSLWSNRFRQTFHSGWLPQPGVAVQDWFQTFRRTWDVACQLHGEEPLSVSWDRLQQEPPTSAMLLLSGHGRDLPTGTQPQHTPLAQLAVVQSAELWWLVKDERLSAHPQQGGHTASIDAIVEVAATGAGAGAVGYATGSRDRTIKLWAPAHAASQLPGGHVRPRRTLRGHSEAITALAVLSTSNAISSTGSSASNIGASGTSTGGGASSDPAAHGDSAAADESGSGGSSARSSSGSSTCSSGGAVLASASIDRTVRLWSLAPLQEGGGAHGRSPLLATLRGHGDAVRGLQLAPDEPGKLVSGGRDARAKLWDVRSGAGGASLASTIKLSASCTQLLSSSGSSSGAGGYLVSVSKHALEVLDLRCAAPVAVLSHERSTGRAITCAAVHGDRLAAGGRRGAAVWDVRALSSSTSSIGSSLGGGGGSGSGGVSSSGTKPLFSVVQPRQRAVSCLHLDRLKLVTGTGAVQLHAGDSLCVWDAGDGRPIKSLSCTMSPVQLSSQSGPHESMWHGGDDAAWELANAMSSEPQQTHEDTGSSDDGSEFSGGGGSPGEAAARASGVFGRMEPGVLAMAVLGPTVVTCDTLGTVLLRDFTQASPLPEGVASAPSGTLTDEITDQQGLSKFWQLSVYDEDLMQQLKP